MSAMSALPWMLGAAVVFWLLRWADGVGPRLLLRTCLGGLLGAMVAPTAWTQWLMGIGLLALILELIRWWRAPIRPPDPYGRQRRDGRQDGDGDGAVSLPSLPNPD